MVRHDLVVSFVLGLGLALVVSALPTPQVASLPGRRTGGGGLFPSAPARGEPRMPSFLRSEAPEAGDGLYIVQFAGPVKGAWLEDLRGSGAEVIEYLPSPAS